MSISVTGKLNEAAKEFPNQSGTSFLIRVGVQAFDRKAKAKVWVNYSGFVFVGNENQAGFYRTALVEGAIVELKGYDIIPEVYGDQNRITLQIQDAKLGYIGTTGNAQPVQQAPQYAPPPPPVQQPQQYQQAPVQQQAPNPYANASNGIDDIPY